MAGNTPRLLLGPRGSTVTVCAFIRRSGKNCSPRDPSKSALIWRKFGKICLQFFSSKIAQTEVAYKHTKYWIHLGPSSQRARPLAFRGPWRVFPERSTDLSVPFWLRWSRVAPSLSHASGSEKNVKLARNQSSPHIETWHFGFKY